MSFVPDETLYQERTRKILGNKGLVKTRQPENNLDQMTLAEIHELKKTDLSHSKFSIEIIISKH